MFKNMHNVRNQKGFTLIELMIVVAIIGILAAVAIPNFLRYQSKSKQSEARVLLSGLYTSQISFFAEENGYGDWSMAAGVVVDVHSLGFAPASVPKYFPDASTVLGGTAVVVNGIASGTTFVTTATGDLDSDATVDTWTVQDSNREPQNTINDVTT